jgi:hypothetical protein
MLESLVRLSLPYIDAHEGTSQGVVVTTRQDVVKKFGYCGVPLP